MRNWQCAIALRLHLCQSTWLETRWHQAKVACGDDSSSHRLIETDQETDVVAVAARQATEHVLGIRITQAEDGDLAAFVDDSPRRFCNDIEPLLVHEPRDDAEQRPIGVLQA